MPRGRSPSRDKAKEIYLQHGGKITNRKIAEILGEDEKVVAVWKSRDNWKVVQQKAVSCTTQKGVSCTTKKPGGQPGNKNAAGHGGTGPPGNKNALKTGEFETLLFECLDPEERRLADAVPKNKIRLIIQEIRLLTVREKRMLQRIEDLKASIAYPDTDMTVVGLKSGTEKGKQTDLKEYRGKLGQIQSIEEALTRVQGRKQSAIDSLHRYGYDDARLALEKRKCQPGTDETESDGFLEALSETAKGDWGDKTIGF